MRRLKVLLSAYACAPGRGSEPGVGWNFAREISRRHDVWVLTRVRHRPAIEKALGGRDVSGLHFVYHDLPASLCRWKRGGRGVQLYYYLWQLSLWRRVRLLHGEVGFDVAHHATFAKYWMPSPLAALSIPFVFGPLGGADSAPLAFWREFSMAGKIYEAFRAAGRWWGERDPLVRFTVSRSAVALAKTPATAARLRRLGARDVRLVSGEALSAEEMPLLARPVSSSKADVRFVGIGNLLHLKGFHLGLRAFARAGLPCAEYWIVGAGPERAALERLARRLRIGDRVRFCGWLPREAALRALAEGDVLLQCALHDSGGWVCAEAMAAGRPVICLDLAGPGAQVDAEMGIKVRAGDPEQAVRDLADAMRRLAADPDLRRRMGEAARRRSVGDASWRRRGDFLDALYREMIARAGDRVPRGAMTVQGQGGT